MTICRECRYYIRQNRSERCGNRNVRREVVYTNPVSGEKIYDRQIMNPLDNCFPEPPCRETNKDGACTMYKPTGILRRLWYRMG